MSTAEPAVLIYSKTFAPNVGGLERITEALAEGLAARGLPVVVATATPGERLAGAGYPIVRRPGLRDLWRLLGNADVLHLAGPALVPLLLARLRRRPVVLLHHTYQAVCPNGMLLEMPRRELCPGHFQAGRVHRCLRCQAVDVGRGRASWRLLAAWPRRALMRAAVHVAPSDWAARRLDLGAVAIAHGLDIAPQKPEAPAAAAPAAEGAAHTVAFVGRLVREKGVDTLISAIAVLRYAGRDVRLKIVGDGPERGLLTSQAALLGILDAVEFVGRVPPPLVARELADATLQAMPSRWGETFGLAALETLARGLPLLTTDIGGQAEVAGDAAVLVPPNHVRALADALAALLDDPARLAQLAARGPERARAFAAATMVDAHAGLLRQVARGDVAPAPGAPVSSS